MRLSAPQWAQTNGRDSHTRASSMADGIGGVFLLRP
jgi:hypothetical protein